MSIGSEKAAKILRTKEQKHHAMPIQITETSSCKKDKNIDEENQENFNKGMDEEKDIEKVFNEDQDVFDQESSKKEEEKNYDLNIRDQEISNQKNRMSEIKEEKQEETPNNSGCLLFNQNRGMSSGKQTSSPRESQMLLDEQLHAQIQEHLQLIKLGDSERWRENEWQKHKSSVGMTFKPLVNKE